MEQISTELLLTVMEAGGTPALIIFLGWRLLRTWNGTGKKIQEISEDLGHHREDFNEFKFETKERLTRVETILEEREVPK